MVGKQERRYQRMITVVLALISLIMVIPLVLLVVASFTSNNEIVLHGYFQKSRYNTNNASLIARKIPVPQEKQINFSVAILVCKQFLKGKIRPAQIFEILSKYLSPIRPGRQYRRYQNPVSAVAFQYRFS